MRILLQYFFVAIYFLSPIGISAQDGIIIKGTVTDKSGYPLIAANVFLTEKSYGSSTDRNGFFIISLPAEEKGRVVELRVRYIGYITQSMTIDLGSGTGVYNFQMEENVLSLKTIVVTAQRRKENLQEVPISISALEKTTIDQSGADRFAELQYHIPNMVIGYEYFTFMTVASIRGVSGASRNIGMENRVGVYVDGVYAGRSIALNQDLLDIDHLEVLRGPQGTMFGKNTISGVINLATRKPHGSSEAALSVEGGNYNHFKTNLSLNLPLVRNRFFAKVSAKTFFRGGYIHNVYNDKKLNGLNKIGGRVQLRYLASEDLEFNLNVDGVRERQDNRTISIETEGEGFELAPGPREVAHDANEFGHRDLLGSAFKIDYNLSNNFTFKSISSYNWYEAQSRFDEDVSPSPFLFSDRDEESRHFTQEFQVASSSTEKTNFVAGLFYFYQNSETTTNATFDSDSPFGYYYIVTPASVKTNQLASYFHGNLKLTDNLILSSGLRYTYEEKNLNFKQKNDPEPFMFPELDNLTDDLSESDFSPKGGVNLFLTDNTMLYGAIARAHKSGGWNANFARTENISFGPEYSTNYELGAKTTAWDNRFRCNAAVFLSKFDDFQVMTFIGTNVEDLLMIVKNAGKVTTKGIELELSAVPISGFNISTGFGYTDARYDVFKNGGGLGVHYDGNRLMLAPKITFNFAANYSFQAESFGSIILHGDFAYRDEMYSEPSNEDPFFMKGYFLINARIGFDLSNSPLNLTLWAKNLTDKLYMRDRGPGTVGTHTAWYGMPRTFGLKISYSFSNFL